VVLCVSCALYAHAFCDELGGIVLLGSDQICDFDAAVDYAVIGAH
jgi:hypothetical protein